MDFIFDPSLVLYLPLYEPDGSSMMSKDVYGHLATVTGALWTPQGRSFDGVDDKIQTGATVPFNTGNIYTAECWAQCGSTGDPITVLSLGTNSPSGGYLDQFGFRTQAIRFCNYANGWTGSAGIATLNTWYHLALVRDGATDNVKIYVNGVLGLDTAYTYDLLTATGVVSLGCVNSLTPGEFLNGKIGEARIYNRALTPAEIQQNYLATKWRYQ